MTLFITVTHLFLCFFLILIILLQPGKDSADIFGGGQGGNKMYGARSQSSPLGKATTLVAIMFMFTSITLAFRSSEEANQKSDIAKKAAELDQKRIEDMKMSFDIPKLRLINPEDLYDKPIMPELNLPNLNLENPLNPPGGLIPEIPKNE